MLRTFGKVVVSWSFAPYKNTTSPRRHDTQQDDIQYNNIKNDYTLHNNIEQNNK